MEPMHLQNPPIVEAMIEFVVEPCDTEVDAKLASLRKLFGDSFPIHRERHEWQLEFALRPGELPTASGSKPGSLGFISFSKKQHRAVQASPDRFAYSQLQLGSYTSWEALAEESAAQWDLFVQTLAPRRVRGVVVRFINRLELPLAGVPVSEFLRLFPNVPDGLPPIRQSIMQVEMPDPATGSVAEVIQTVAPSPNGNGIFLVNLDIQVRANVDLAVDDPSVWERLAALRPLKNQIFFASVTAGALEQYR